MLIVHPSLDGRGKYHAARPVSEVAACGALVLLDMDPMLAIHVDGEEPHPIVCRRCLAQR